MTACLYRKLRDEARAVCRTGFASLPTVVRGGLFVLFLCFELYFRLLPPVCVTLPLSWSLFLATAPNCRGRASPAADKSGCTGK